MTYIEKQFVNFLLGICIDDNHNRLKKNNRNKMIMM